MGPQQMVQKACIHDSVLALSSCHITYHLALVFPGHHVRCAALRYHDPFMCFLSLFQLSKRVCGPLCGLGLF